MYKINKTIVILILAFSSQILIAQKSNSSPYTRYGLGEITEVSTAAYFGMANASVALSEYNHLNLSNPASYSSLIQYKPIFDVGLYGKFQTLKTENSSLNQKNFGLRNFSLGLPIGTKTGVAFGLSPYSTVGYDINSYNTVEGDSVRFNYKGKGGINKVFLGVGREIVNEGDSIKLSVGFNASYLFGTIENSRSVIYSNSTYYSSKINNFKTINGANFDLGIHYEQKLNDKTKLLFGIDYTIGNDLNISKDFYAYNFKMNQYGLETAKDTIDVNDDQKGKVSIPGGIKIGAALILNKKLILSAQFEQKAWNTYQEIYDGVDETPIELKASSKIALGLSYTPTLMRDWNSKSRSIFQKSTYRLGLSSSNTNLSLNSTLIKDYGISFGISTPLLSSRSFSTLDFGFNFGKLGTTNNNLIEDNYFKIYLGFSLVPSSYDRWFRKRKYD